MNMEHIMGEISAQYEENPSDPLQEPNMQAPQAAGGKKDLKKYIFIAAGILVLLAIVYFVFLSGGKTGGGGEKDEDGICDPGENCVENPADCSCPYRQVCSATKKSCVDEKQAADNNGTPADNLQGNSICDPGENCFDNPVDCKCRDDEYCSDDKVCVKPSCGNGKCEVYESPESCCIDCECLMPYEVCNTQTKSCEPPQMNLSAERALLLARGYFESQGMTIASIEDEGVYRFNDIYIRQFKVEISEEGFIRRVGITESEGTIEITSIE